MIAPTLLLSLVLAACSSFSSNPRAAGNGALKPESQRKAAPDFSLKDANGKTVQLSDYRGKVVLLNFWATWCGPCKLEIPWFVEFERKHKDQGFAVVGISMDDDGWDAVRPFISQMGVNYRVLVGNDEVAQNYGGVDSLPTTFLIDRAGKIAAVHIGLVSKSSYEKDLEELFADSSRAAVRGGAGAPALFVGAR